MRRKRHDLPAPWFVRTFAVILLAIDIAILALVAFNFETLGWSAYLLLLGSVTTAYFPLMALKTGNPEWVLLDLIMPL